MYRNTISITGADQNQPQSESSSVAEVQENIDNVVSVGNAMLAVADRNDMMDKKHDCRAVWVLGRECCGLNPLQQNRHVH